MTAGHSALAQFDAPCVVPGAVGKTLLSVRRLIVAAHCRTGRVTSRYSPRPKGRVIAPGPRPGAVLANEGRVDLVVSKGRRPRGH